MLGVAAPGGETRGLLGGIVKHKAHLTCIETSRAGGRAAGAEGACNTVRCQAAIVAESGASHGHDDTGTDVIAERYRPNQTCAVNSVQFTHRQRRRHDRAAGM